MTSLLVVPSIIPDISYTTITANVTISATTAATATTIITAPAFTPNGVDSFWLEFYAARCDTAAVAGATVICTVYDNGAELLLGAQTGGEISQIANPAAAAFIAPQYGRVKVTPTAVAHTYSIRGFQGGGNGLIAGGGNFMPPFLRITKAP